MPNWSNFQSVIQLAIGLNCAFATISPFLGSASERDRLLAESYTQQLTYYRDYISKSELQAKNTDIIREDVVKSISKVDSLKNESSSTDQAITDFLNGYIRIFCLIAASISIIALFESSYASNMDVLNPVWHVYLYIEYFPFVIGVVRIMALASRHLSTRNKIVAVASTLQAIEVQFRNYKAGLPVISVTK